MGKLLAFIIFLVGGYICYWLWTNTGLYGDILATILVFVTLYLAGKVAGED